MTDAQASSVRWRKSNGSGDGNCVEVAELAGDLVGVRDSKDRGGAVLTFSPAAWGDFLDGVRSGGMTPGGQDG